jgi:hypothetical protein
MHAITDANKENGLEVHTKKTTYMLITPSPEGRAKSYH